MTKTSMLILAGTVLASAAAYVINRRRRNAPQTALQDSVEKSRHLNPVFSHLKQETTL